MLYNKVNILLLLLYILSSILNATGLPVKDIQQAISEKNASWRATENKFTAMSAEERRWYAGAIPVRPEDVASDQILSLPTVEILPDSFDWRDNNGDWVTPVKDQGQCGSCWAFSAVGQVEAWWKIRNGDPAKNIDLSEQFLLACSDAGNCEDGGRIDESLEFIAYTGIPYESDLPYRAVSSIPCSDTKPGWENHAVSIPAWGYITLAQAHVDNIKSAVFRHPLSVSFEVFDDFYSYFDGVYEHVFGESSGWHAVVIVGWNDREESWIVKNSWGDSWGDSGYFRIKWGDSSMGRFAPYIWDETPTAFLVASTNSIDIELTYGDIDTLEVSIYNYGPDAAHFFANESILYANEPDWLVLEQSAGILSISDSAYINLILNTRELKPGNYAQEIRIITNDIIAPHIKIPVSLTVTKPQYDARVNRLDIPPDGFTLLSWATLGCEIGNVGAQTMTDFDVACHIKQNGKTIFQDTSHVALLPVNSRQTVDFAPFKLRQTGHLDCEINIVHSPNDYNDFNNVLSAKIPVTHLVEGFESTNEHWLIDSGWAFTDAVNGHSGSASAHVNGGIYPYLNNMNTTMTYLPGFELAGLDTFFVTFWTRYVTADSNDFCLVETSGDSATWEFADSFTGVQPAWERHVLNLTRYAQERREKAWVRFQFVSDALGTSIGVLIDDLEVYTETIEETGTNPETGVARDIEQPVDYHLAQNYPNPFNPATTISYSIPVSAHVMLTIYDIQGRFVEHCIDVYQPAGQHKLTWTATAQPAGIYFATLVVNGENGYTFMDRIKMVLVK
ncbi:T9SS C-terminal target domain-containing protein [candidate division KSB1 bacterium]|nr:T9SS type A sorting domain-containing protein [candidate division KSB1 bacterium]RQW05393.1 MAG: T9SS C-terminal target domain-containing protein [candidate division KSB1 bacterium]